jgi:hypothetical protein
MLEYMFFHEKPYQLFKQWLVEKGISPESCKTNDGFEVSIPEDIDDALGDEVDERYDQLLDMNRDLLAEDGEQGGASFQASAISIQLKDGRTTYADVDSKLMGRIMGVLTPEEFGLVVEAIATAVEEPQEQSYCKRVRDKEVSE